MIEESLLEKGRLEATPSARIPPPATEFQPGETIVLTVSLGPEYFACPDFDGMTRGGGQGAGRAARSRAHRAARPREQRQATSSARLPGAGTRVRYGSTVTVYLRVILGAHVRRRQLASRGRSRKRGAGRRLPSDLRLEPASVGRPSIRARPRSRGSETALAASGLRPCVAHLSYVGNVASWDPTDTSQDA